MNFEKDTLIDILFLFQHTDEQLGYTMIQLFVAGHETTATSLKWLVLCLINYPDHQTRMRKEIERVVGTSKLPSLEQKEDLPFCEAFITESLRMNSVAPLAPPHGLSEEGVLVKFTNFMFCLKVLRPSDPNYWKNVGWIPCVFSTEYCSECQTNRVMGQWFGAITFCHL